MPNARSSVKRRSLATLVSIAPPSVCRATARRACSHRCALQWHHCSEAARTPHGAAACTASSSRWCRTTTASAAWLRDWQTRITSRSAGPDRASPLRDAKRSNPWRMSIGSVHTKMRTLDGITEPPESKGVDAPQRRRSPKEAGASRRSAARARSRSARPESVEPRRS